MTKYVILSRIFPVILSDAISHREAENILIGGRIKGKATSAGFFYVDAVNGEIKVRTFGDSGSLSLGPGPEGAELLEMLLKEGC